jgi:UDP-glucose 4-epimerase
MKILVTGGAGYIGSHTCIELLNVGHEVIIVDNLSNSKEESIKCIEKITGKNIIFYKIDITEKDNFREIFKKHKFDMVIHFAGLKAVGESVNIPLMYYYNNTYGTMVLCELMKEFNIKNLIFSSSATVYGNPLEVPIKEDSKLEPVNPYGRTKLFIEYMLKDIFISDKQWNIIILRYFNPIGSHKSGMIRENPNNTPNNLMPFIIQVASGKKDILYIFGDDYNTKDGTGVRDYIHVVDLAKGHIKAIDNIQKNCGLEIYNLGTGIGYSVFEIISVFEKITGINIPYKIIERRAGDIDICFADPLKAINNLKWKAELNIEDMCRDSWA